MEYIYTAMLLHSAKQPVTEENVKKVLHAAGVKTDEGRIKALVAALDGVDIDVTIKEASIPMMAAPVAAQAAPSSGSTSAPKKEEKKKSEEDAAIGLAGLFG